MKKKSKFVSIILNCYNGEKFLFEALKSVTSQTYKNWELIFWDNKSTDNSKKIFKKFKNPNFKYFFSKKHTSLYSARNLAIKKSKGEFIAFIDADDTWEQDKLKNQIKLFKNQHVGLVYGNLWILNQNKKRRKILSKRKLITGKIYGKLLSNYNIGIITAVVRRSLLKKNNLKFDERYNHIGDFDLFNKLSKICNFDAVQSPVATYRIHGDNLSLKNISKEINETKFWIRQNRSKLRKSEIDDITRRLNNREFISFKLGKNFISSFKYFVKNKNLWKNLKNFIFLISPKYILKKYMWYQ